MLWRHDLTFGPGGGKVGGIEVCTQVNHILFIHGSFNRSQVAVSGEPVRRGGEQAGGLREVPCCQGLLCQSQQALPGDCAGIERCRKPQALAIREDGALMLALCPGNLSLDAEQAAGGIAISDLTRESQTLVAQTLCPNEVFLEAGEFCQTRQGLAERSLIARFARERQILLQQSCCSPIVSLCQGECGQVSACAGPDGDVLVQFMRKLEGALPLGDCFGFLSLYLNHHGQHTLVKADKNIAQRDAALGQRTSRAVILQINACLGIPSTRFCHRQLRSELRSYGQALLE